MPHRSSLPTPVPVDCGGTTVATWTLGPRVGPDQDPTAEVVVCHGTPWSADTWAEVALSLARRRRVRLWDMPGYGASAAAEHLDLATQARRLARLLASWDGPPPHVVAHDVGGAVALGAHLEHARDYASLFLWDAVVLDPWGSPFFELASQHGDVLERLPARLHRALVREYVAGSGSLPDQVLDRLVEPWTGADGPRRFYRQVAALSPDDTRPLAARLHEVRCPVRVGWGDADPWVPVEQAHRLARSLPPGTEVVTLPGAGHLVPLERPSDVLRELERWWVEVGDATA